MSCLSLQTKRTKKFSQERKQSNATVEQCDREKRHRITIAANRETFRCEWHYNLCASIWPFVFLKATWVVVHFVQTSMIDVAFHLHLCSQTGRVFLR
ncbi:hypothetical protein DEO72_LG9g1295 [Vigna unguiculata]|uniref:Uncharacterized protein n=1 Tax=Vigna unguiculata TaxID=3917 RepID=A0A4D6N062_VIGUN|nr:hypothetical protein DEO72_LG9g1295 [Vigna unguiculata]